MRYAVELSGEAEGDLDALYRSDRKLFHRMVKKMASLEESPYEGKALVGNHKGEFSLRIGSYRLVYELDSTNHILYVLSVKHGKHAY